MSGSRIEVIPIGGAIGAEVTGVDLSRPLDEATFSEVRHALLEHLVIVFRDQVMSQEEHKAFGRRFGTLNVHDYVAGLPDHPEIIEIAKEADYGGYNFGGTWHSDVSYLEQPSLASILYAKEVPPRGGDTLFTNAYLAYETLSDGMRRMLDELRAVHSAGEVYGAGSPRGVERAGQSSRMRVRPDESAYAEVVHPVVRTHPDTGRRLLYVNYNFTTRFEDMSVEESAPLLGFLFLHLQRPEFGVRVRWRENTVTMWDNRCTQHLAVNDYQGFRRRMHRVTIDGDRPY